MRERDARSLTIEQQEELRRQCVVLVESGKSRTEVAELLGVNRASVGIWHGLYKKGGYEALKQSRRGRRIGSQRRLTKRQETNTQRAIQDKVPEQVKLPFALWTRRAVQDFIEARYGVSLPIRTVGEYLRRWGFTPQRPLKRAYEQNPEAVERWLQEEYPSIEARAKAENAEIHWGDETGLRSMDQAGRGYSPCGETPTVGTMASHRFSTSVISTITNQGTLRFMVYSGSLKVATFLLFLRRLIKGSKRKVFLIVDNLKVHKARAVRKWLQENETHIELFFLPPYAPELNPDEYVNNDIKQAVAAKKKARSKPELQTQTRSYLRSLQRKPKKVQKFFQHKHVQYAA